MEQTEYAVETNRLTKQYKNHKAVDQVSLHIRRGEIYGFIGRNGAGKTTFMKMVCGLALPDNGELSLFGHGGKETADHFSRIGCLIESPGLYPNLSALDNLKLKEIGLGIHTAGYLEEILKLVGLADTEGKKVKNFSLGMKQRLGVAMALVGEPDMLVLDEPINGLDPQGIAEVRETLLRLNREKNITIMISSHILEELSKLADTYGIIHEGKLIQELSREELARKNSDYIEVKTGDPKAICIVLDRLNMPHYKVTDRDTVQIYGQPEEVSRINRELAMAGCDIASIRVVAEELEHYFFELTGGAEHV